MTTKRLEGRDEAIIDPDLAIIDSHIHLFHLPSLRYMLDEYLADANAGHNIIAAVYVETQSFVRPDGPEVMRAIGEVEFANGVGAMSDSGVYGSRRIGAGIVGYADLRLGDEVASYLDRALQVAPDRFRGIRQVALYHKTEAPYRYILTNRPPKGILETPTFDDGFRHLAPRGLSFETAVIDYQLPDLAALADKFPRTTIILNHLGMPMALDMDEDGRHQVFLVWRDLIRDLSKRPNVICKLGGLGMPFSGLGFEMRSDPIGYLELATAWKPYIETAIEAFGPGRCMMESNFPPDGRSCGFVPLWNAMKHITRDYSPNEKTALFRGTAALVYRIELPEDLR
jgi:predicted TIM-barrel fold metal-dependent hydrolase